MIAEQLAKLLLGEESPKDFFRRRNIGRTKPIPRIEDVDFEVLCRPEEMEIEGNAGDEEAEQWVKDQLEAGNVWAWCWVEVKAEWTSPDGIPFQGSNYLGGCSYRSRRDFMSEEPGSYYPDMRQEAYNELVRAVERHYDQQ